MVHTRKLSPIVLSITMILSIGLSLARPRVVFAQVNDGLKRQVNAQTGKLSFIGPANGRSLSVDKVLGISPATDLADPARALANRFAPEFGLQNPERDLTQLKSQNLEDGRLTARYQQNFQGIPVMGGELIVNTDQNGDLYSITGELSANISLNTQPTIDSEQARETALQSIAKWYQKTPAGFFTSEPELWIFDERLLQSSTRPAELVWRLEVAAIDSAIPVRELVLINAQRGNISLHFNQIDTAWHTSAGAVTTRPGSLDAPVVQSGNAIIKTYTAGNLKSLPGTFLCDQSSPTCPAGDAHAKAAHKYAIGTYNLFYNNHNRNSIDNNNMPVISTVHYDVDYQNAFWSGEQMVYGDGFGFALADDVVAHELTHGVTQHESNLFYFYQSGAINESLSDLWGEFYDQGNNLGNDTVGVKWQIGEEISGLGSIRSMSNPPDFSNPDRITSPYYVLDAFDNGGVHSNSGVNNKAVFLMVDGGTFNGKTVTALGWVKTAAIYYEVNSNLLVSGADYSDLYFALQSACSNLVGQKGITSADCQEVKDAIDAVEMNMQPIPNFSTDAPLCGTGSPSIAFAENLENGSGNWSFSNGGTTRWQVDSSYGPYAQSGLHSLYADDYPATVTDATARLTSFTVPSGAYLHFAHAYEFESFAFFSAYYDGGVLEYSTNGGATWVDAGSLIDFNGYKGTISNDWSNPLKGRAAFVDSSHGYISTRLNLASLAGRNVTFRWRMGLDEIGSAWGWWVDNIKVYTCKNTPVATALVSPSGDIGANYSPTYTWNKVNGATWYYLWVNGPGGNIIKKWYESSLVCGDNTCSVTPATTLRGGVHNWWVRTWNNSGYGPWSTAMTFSTTIPRLPDAAALVAPEGNIETNYNPTYTWNKVDGASMYYLWVNGPTGNVIKMWYDASAVCGVSSCSVTPATSLGYGVHSWWVRTWNAAGYGPWSTGMNFTTTMAALPGQTTLITPNGSQGINHNPTYTWNIVAGATWYYLWVNGPSGNLIKSWYSASDVCDSSNCSVTPATSLTNGTHTWWVRTWNAAGYGPWSNPSQFDIP